MVEEKGSQRVKPAGQSVAVRVTKAVAILVGGACTFVSFASLVGIATGNGWARGIIAAVLTIGVPALAADRVLPQKDAAKARPGLVGDAVAMVLLGIALLFVGIGEPVTRPLLVREGDRLAEDGYDVAAHVVYLMAGVRPVDAPPAPSALPAASSGGH